MPTQRFTTAEAEAIRAELATGAERQEVAQRWNASITTINRIASRINPYDQDEELSTSLIPVFDAGNLLLCNARDLHAFLQVRRDFSNWIKGRIDQYGFEEEIDFIVAIINDNELDSPDLANQVTRHGGDRKSIDYHLSLDMAKELAMIENNEVGRKVRRYFIQMERQARELLEERANRVLPADLLKRKLKDTQSAKFMLIMQDQSRKVAKMLSTETDYGVRYNLHCQLRQVNDCLGIPTLSLSELAANPLALIE